MTSLHNALMHHAYKDRFTIKKLQIPSIPEDQMVIDDTKSTAQILRDSKNIVTKLKGSIKSDMESLAKNTAELTISKTEVIPPPAPKSPRLKLPVAIPEPSNFAVPLYPRK